MAMMQQTKRRRNPALGTTNGRKKRQRRSNNDREPDEQLLEFYKNFYVNKEGELSMWFYRKESLKVAILRNKYPSVISIGGIPDNYKECRVVTDEPDAIRPDTLLVHIDFPELQLNPNESLSNLVRFSPLKYNNKTQRYEVEMVMDVRCPSKYFPGFKGKKKTLAVCVYFFQGPHLQTLRLEHKFDLYRPEKNSMYPKLTDLVDPSKPHQQHAARFYPHNEMIPLQPESYLESIVPTSTTTIAPQEYMIIEGRNLPDNMRVRFTLESNDSIEKNVEGSVTNRQFCKCRIPSIQEFGFVDFTGTIVAYVTLDSYDNSIPFIKGQLPFQYIRAITSEEQLMGSIMNGNISSNWFDDYGRNLFHNVAPLDDISPYPVNYLLNNGVDINRSDQHGITPLHIAVLSRNFRAVKIFLNHGASPSLHMKDVNGETPMDLARRNGYFSIVQELLQYYLPDMVVDRSKLPDILRGIKKYKDQILTFKPGVLLNIEDYALKTLCYICYAHFFNYPALFRFDEESGFFHFKVSTDILTETGLIKRLKAPNAQINLKHLRPLDPMELDQPKTLAQMVEVLVIDLSNGMSNMALNIIKCKGKNIRIPDQLLTLALATHVAAKKLIDIARKCANTNYEKFPSIRETVINATSTLEGETTRMYNAIKKMQARPDSHRWWVTFGKVCKTLTESTIQLLAIFHEAITKRLFVQADRILRAIEGFNTNSADSDPSGFANGASDIATDAQRLAKWTKEKSRDIDAPGHRAEFQRLASELRNLGHRLIEVTNDYLPEPDNIEKLERVEDVIEEIKYTTQVTKQTLQKRLRPVDHLNRINRRRRTAMGDPEVACKQLYRAVKQLDTIKPKMKKAVGEQNADDVMKLAKQLLVPLDLIYDAVATPRDELTSAAEDLKYSLSQVTSGAVQGDENLTRRAVRSMSHAKKRLTHAAREFLHSTIDSERKRRFCNEAFEVQRLVNVSAMVASQMLTELSKSPADAESESNHTLMDTRLALARSVERLLSVCDLAPQEKTMAECTKALEQSVEFLRAAMLELDVQHLTDAFQVLSRCGEELLYAYSRRLGVLQSSQQNPEEFKQLRELWGKYREKREALVENSCDETIADFNKWGAEMISRANQVLRSVKADVLVPLQRVEVAIKDLENSIDCYRGRANVTSVTAAANFLSEAVRELGEEFEPPKEVRQLISSVPKLAETMIKLATDSLKDPMNSGKKHTVSEFAKRFRYPLVLAQCTVRKGSPNLKMQQEIARVSARLADISESMRNKDKKALGTAVRKTSVAIKHVCDTSKAYIEELQLPPYKRDQIKKANSKLEAANALLKQVWNTTPLKVARAINVIRTGLDATAKCYRSNIKADLIGARSKIRSAIGIMHSTGDAIDGSEEPLGAIKSKSLCVAAKEMRESIAELTSTSMAWATQQMRETGKDYKDIIKEAQQTDGLDSLLSSLSKLKLDDAAYEMHVDNLSKQEFEKAIQEVATVVTAAARDQDERVPEAEPIAKELFTLAQAAKTGKRKAMVKASQHLVHLIQEFIASMRSLAEMAATKSSMYQDKLMALSQILNNYAVHINIMVAVKAAVIEVTADADESLASLTRSFGSLMTESVNVVSITKSAILKLQG